MNETTATIPPQKLHANSLANLKPFSKSNRPKTTASNPNSRVSQARDIQLILANAIRANTANLRTVAELSRCWIDFEALIESRRTGPKRHGLVSRATIPPAAPVPVKPSTVSPASFQEPDAKPGETPPPQGTKT